jgi:pimeloyl-ACP methyl ester carboxylesterase
MWDGFRDALVADGAEPSSVYTVDLLGHGATPRPSRPLHIDDYVRQVRKLILRHKLSGVHLLGHSLGGVVALAMASTHPDLIDQAVVIGVPYGRSDDQRNDWLDIIMEVTRVDEDAESDPVADVVPKLVDRWCNGEISAAFVEKHLPEVDPVTFGLVFRISMTSEPAVEEMAPEIEVPITVCAGSHDSEVDAAGVDELARALDRGSAVIIDGHHHLGIMDRPSDFLSLLR